MPCCQWLAHPVSAQSFPSKPNRQVRATAKKPKPLPNSMLSWHHAYNGSRSRAYLPKNGPPNFWQARVYVQNRSPEFLTVLSGLYNCGHLCLKVYNIVHFCSPLYNYFHTPMYIFVQCCSLVYTVVRVCTIVPNAHFCATMLIFVPCCRVISSSVQIWLMRVKSQA